VVPGRKLEPGSVRSKNVEMVATSLPFLEEKKISGENSSKIFLNLIKQGNDMNRKQKDARKNGRIKDLMRAFSRSTCTQNWKESWSGIGKT